ncbi:uncharacterized protein LOC103370914 [Stegastes partitus]|uniref:Uncharacterized protein LOC103370914 n=1 Tax=Stegastes partitus TaxID=144197 RepID=A0A9Y4TW05_9TELE|nr:PREDICTED: uncharacterized protein LOC103370914 [Stegastes partitus]
MDCDGNLPHSSQCPATSAKVRRNMEAKHEESGREKVEWMLGLKTSRPRMSIELSSSVCGDDGCVDEEHDGRSHNPVYAHVEAPQKDLQCAEDKAATAAAHTQMANTKPKAGALVACRQLIDGNEAASLGDQSALTPKGAISLANVDPERNSSALQAAVADSRTQYYMDLCKQVEERKQQTEWERRQKAADEQKHFETMQRSIWGMPGSGAPNYHQGSTRRTNSLFIAGILPQEQVRDKGFSGTPFHCL